MGYETKLIIGKTYPNLMIESDKGKLYVAIIATIDLSCSCFTDTVIDEGDNKEAFIYSTSITVEEKIEVDCYGKTLYAIDPIKVLNVMKKAHKKEYYRRYAAAIPMLESLIKDFKTENLKCILYGH